MLPFIRYIWSGHFDRAVHSALLVAAGLLAAVPVRRCRMTALQRPPAALLRIVMRLMGPTPGILRTACVIWVFNATVMFLTMASGFHPLPPRILGVWTGLNIGLLAGSGSPGEGTEAARTIFADSGRRVPPRPLSVVCGLLVFALELPAFFFAVAMGAGMGAEVAGGKTAYADALPVRAAAFGAVIMPVLLISALAEAVAIRGAAASLK